MRQAGLPEPEYNTKGLFTLIVKRNAEFNVEGGTEIEKSSTESGTEIEKSGTESGTEIEKSGTEINKQKIIFELIEKNNNITIRELAKILNIQKSIVQKHFDALKNAGIISREGSTKAGKWKILKNI